MTKEQSDGMFELIKEWIEDEEYWRTDYRDLMDAGRLKEARYSIGYAEALRRCRLDLMKLTK